MGQRTQVWTLTYLIKGLQHEIFELVRFSLLDIPEALDSPNENVFNLLLWDIAWNQKSFHTYHTAESKGCQFWAY